MARYWTSDLHLGHARIIELCSRPFSDTDEMNETLISNINDTCGPDDELWVLGDVVMGKFTETIQLLGLIKARLIMVAGNHDRVHAAYRLSSSKKDEASRLYSQYFEQVHVDGLDVVRLEGEVPVAVNHFPYPGGGDSHGEDRYTDLRPVDRGLPLLCGHVHQAWRVQGRQFNVGVDVNEFRPVAESVVTEWAAMAALT